jgi:tetratricopeptide (TPR) repeat protein
MSYDLCLHAQAEKPYYIENIRTPIYSLEELCFYLYNNICLIDASLINEGLCDWIRDELKLPKLYRQLYAQLEKQDSAAFFVLPIFREAGYLSHQEMREFQEQLSKLEVQSEDMKQKLRGDYLVKEKMFARAIREYRQILGRRNPGRLGTQFYASVLNNLGAAYAGLFRFEEAAECFWESYSLIRTKETFRKYVSTLPLFLSEEEYEKKLKELRPDMALVRNIQEYNAKICTQPTFQAQLEQMRDRDTAEIVEELKEAYCRSTKI